MKRLEQSDSKLFKGMSFQEFDIVRKSVKQDVRKFSRGNTLWREGEVVHGIGILESGSLACLHYNPDGKVQLVSMLFPSDLINVEAAVSYKRTSPYFIIADTAGSYTWYPYTKLFNNPEISPKMVCTIQANLLSYLADQTIRLIKKSSILSKHTVQERIIIFFNILRENQGDVIDIGMNQEELAQYLCVDRSSLSEELNKMRRNGLIDYNKRIFHLNYAIQDSKQERKTVHI